MNTCTASQAPWEGLCAPADLPRQVALAPGQASLGWTLTLLLAFWSLVLSFPPGVQKHPDPWGHGWLCTAVLPASLRPCAGMGLSSTHLIFAPGTPWCWPGNGHRKHLTTDFRSNSCLQGTGFSAEHLRFTWWLLEHTGWRGREGRGVKLGPLHPQQFPEHCESLCPGSLVNLSPGVTCSARHGLSCLDATGNVPTGDLA